MIELLGLKLYSCYLAKDNKVLAYSLNYSIESCKKHLEEIKKFHRLNGKIIEDSLLDKKFERYILEKIKKDVTPKFIKNQLSFYRGKEVYREVLKINKGSVTSYSEIAQKLNLSIWTVIRYLKYNPFIILIPCHRIIRKDGSLAGYTPLGIKFKREILKSEGYL